MSETWMKIAKSRMVAYANQARRLAGISNELSPADIEATLAATRAPIASNVGIGLTFSTQEFLNITTGPLSYGASMTAGVAVVTQERVDNVIQIPIELLITAEDDIQ